MPRTDLENLEKRRQYSKYWRELPVVDELRDLLRHELVEPAERRSHQRDIDAGDQEQLALSLKGLRQLLIIRERKRLAFATLYPGISQELRAA